MPFKIILVDGDGAGVSGVDIQLNFHGVKPDERFTVGTTDANGELELAVTTVDDVELKSAIFDISLDGENFMECATFTYVPGESLKLSKIPVSMATSPDSFQVLILQENDNTPVEGASVAMLKGGKVVWSTLTSEHGLATIDNAQTEKCELWVQGSLVKIRDELHDDRGTIRIVHVGEPDGTTWALVTGIDADEE
ncbi:MAG: hypothetical protein ABIJ92_00750 [Candidatus Aenigmatarchaeota archaeon]